MQERSISVALIEEALVNPTKILYDARGRLMFKKLYKKRHIPRLLIVIGEKVKDTLRVITVIETSKIKKYL